MGRIRAAAYLWTVSLMRLILDLLLLEKVDVQRVPLLGTQARLALALPSLRCSLGGLGLGSHLYEALADGRGRASKFGVIASERDFLDTP